MKLVFADTFFWIALTNPHDEAHVRARESAQAGVLSPICTTEEVLTEYLNYFAGWGASIRRSVALNVENIVANSAVWVFAQSSTSFLDGLALYGARLDKGYSLTDCISMAVMRNQGIVDVLTNDVHFEQEGFRAIFRQAR